MGSFRDLPADIVELILEHLAHPGQQAQLYTVACAAQTLAALTQVRVHTQIQHSRRTLTAAGQCIQAGQYTQAKEKSLACRYVEA